MITISKQSKSGNTIYNHFVFTEEPHIKSYASAILLRNDFLFQDEDYIKHDFFTWLKFREEYLTEVQEKEGDLKCAYCGKTNLEIGGMKPEDFKINNMNPLLATIDHIVPLSKDGERYNKKNLCVCCKTCNRKKGDKSAEEFVKK